MFCTWLTKCNQVYNFYLNGGRKCMVWQKLTCRKPGNYLESWLWLFFPWKQHSYFYHWKSWYHNLQSLFDLYPNEICFHLDLCLLKDDKIHHHYWKKFLNQAEYLSNLDFFRINQLSCSNQVVLLNLSHWNLMPIHKPLWQLQLLWFHLYWCDFQFAFSYDVKESKHHGQPEFSYHEDYRQEEFWPRKNSQLRN